MSKKIIKLFFITGLTGVLIYGLIGSGAWFTDSAASAGSISSGDFNLVVSGDSIKVENLEPGRDYQSFGEFCLENQGDYDMKFRGYIKDVEDPGNLQSFLLLKVEIKAINETDHNNYGPTGTSIEIAHDVPLSTFMDQNDILALSPGNPNSPQPFAPGMKICYILSGKLSADAGNEQINKTINTNLFFESTQWINSGW
jgi:hypothetical protein